MATKTRMRLDQLKGGTLTLAAEAAAMEIVVGGENYLKVDANTGSETIVLGEDVNVGIVLEGAISGTAFKDEDNMSSDSATAVASQQSIKAYVDGEVANAGTSFFMEDEAGTEREINNATEVQFSGSNGLGVASSGAGTNGDPYVFDITVDSAQTAIETMTNSSLAIGAGENLAGIDFGTTGEILFTIGVGGSGVDQIKLEDGALLPVTDDDIDLGSSSAQFKDAHFDGTVNADGLSMEGNIVMGTNSITGLADPSSAQDAATKAYVDATAQGLSAKDSVRAATVANITLSGDSQTIDGVSIVAGDRVLVKEQSSASENGIYVCASGSWARAEDLDSNAEVEAGAYFFVEEGTTFADTGFVLTTDGAITIDTTGLAFTQFSGAGQITAGDGLQKSGNLISADLKADGGIVIESGELAIDLAASSFTNQLADSDLATITTGNKVSGSAVQLSTNSALENNSGLELKTNIAGDGLAITESGGDQILSVGVDDSTIELSGDALQLKQADGSDSSAGVMGSHILNIVAFHSVPSGSDQILVNADLTYSSSGNPGCIDDIGNLVQTVDASSVQDLNKSGLIEVYLNGQLLLPDFGDNTGSSTFNNTATADYKFVNNSGTMNIVFQTGTIEVGDLIYIRGLVG